ncbi:MAG TPA: phage tail protein [Pseudomonas sp.]|uniref:phage tail assembly chaperone n=1 Tax=Pseudomonas sp. TaxID=306 RepID=UPI000ECAC17A|nr:phage tail assembly chaperone [Pseudomonas sp.]HAB02340.1 phage tail protein [Pseudomonas sp.]
MTIYVVPNNKGFWLNDDKPEGGVAISDELHRMLLMGECEGKSINWQTSPPSLQDPQIKADAVTERAWRNAALITPCAIRDRHRDEQELFRSTTLSPERYVELLNYIQTLRDWPQLGAFPDSGQRPMPPTWLTEHL